MNRRSSGNLIGVGVTTIVLIFVMLCMITFAVLSLVTARADLRQSRRNAEYITEYHEAENRANDILLSVITTMEDYLDTKNAKEFYSRVRADLDGSEGITFSDDTHLNYTVSAGDERLLCISLELSYEEGPDGTHYRILSWNTETTHEWDPDASLPLYEPE